MKTIKFLFLIMFIPLFLLCGCKNKTNDVIGFWKSVNEFDYITYDKHEVVSLQEKYVSFDGGTEIPVLWEENNGHLIVSKKDNFGFDFTLEIEKIDENNISIKKEGFPRRNGKYEQYVRISKEEMEKIIKAPEKKRENIGW